jgi:xanthine dehydrogenase accessory factor
MTKEISEIVTAFKEAQRQGLQTALATVVHVEGSSYRRPGARMLVEDNGKITGAISGGCLEGDALRKALLAINQKQNKLVTYNTLDDDDLAFGVQLGCNGIVHILFEPIDPMQANHPVVLLEECFLQRKNAVLATLFSLKNYNTQQPGTCFFSDGERTYQHISDPELALRVTNDAATVLTGKSSLLKEYKDPEYTAFLELVEPPVSLVIVGAGNDAQPLAEIASVLGWQVTVIEGRSTHANKHRFPKAHQIIVGKPGEARNQLVIDQRTFFVLMTHNYNYDVEMLGLLLEKGCRYIGTLGPKKRLEKMLTELQNKGLVITEEKKNTIYGPIGLDIGAEAAEEIALSILAEIKAVLAERSGTFIRDRINPIHSEPAPVLEKTKTDVE